MTNTTTKTLTDSQHLALATLVAEGGKAKGREGWANGSTVNRLIKLGLVDFVTVGWYAQITDAGRAALAADTAAKAGRKGERKAVR